MIACSVSVPPPSRENEASRAILTRAGLSLRTRRPFLRACVARYRDSRLSQRSHRETKHGCSETTGDWQRRSRKFTRHPASSQFNIRNTLSVADSVGRRGTCKSGIGSAAKRCRVILAIRRAQVFARSRLALSLRARARIHVSV